jgi:hypothetical protein
MQGVWPANGGWDWQRDKAYKDRRLGKIDGDTGKVTIIERAAG